jgi:chromate reductase
MRILALSGSLRAASINSALLRAAARLAAPPCQIEVYRGLGDLPLFNPDLEDAAPLPVVALRAAVARAGALLIASPEYAHGVSAVMKNALDWLVSFEGFVALPAAVLNSSPRAHHAHAALLETLRTMSASIVAEACVALPLLGAALDEEGIVHDPGIAGLLRGALRSLEAGARSAAAPRFAVE